MTTNNPAPRVLVLQHADPEHPGLILDSLRHVGAQVETIRTDLAQTTPTTLENYAGLIIMGGPQSVYEEDKYPYLRAEKQLAKEAIDNNIPLLGVCLGSQVIADVLGSGVHPGPAPELGWKPVKRAPEAANNPILSALPETFTPLHWHGDIYDLPKGATPIGSSEMTATQGFSYNQNVYALLFHLEMTEAQITQMATQFPEDIRRANLEPSALLDETPARAEALREAAINVFGRWSNLLLSERG